MADRAFQNLSLFDDDSFEEADETLYLKELLLLDMLSQCKSIEFMRSLRQAIAHFKHRVRDPQDTLHANGSKDQTVEFSRNHLISELDQIAEALTIERAQYYVDRLIKSVSEIKTSPINDINLNRWKEY